jgi:hypothetical protein
MKLTDLRKLIKEEVETALDEADKASKAAPKTFEEFRKAIGAAAKTAGAPQDFVDEILDTDYEGGGVAGALGSGWNNYSYELKDIKDEAELWDTFTYYAHDAIVDAASEYSNAWNYGPGRKAGGRFDAGDLAGRVEKVLSGAKMKKADKGPLKKVSGDIGAEEIMKPLAAVMKGESKTTKVTMRMGGGVKGNASKNPAMDIADPKVKDVSGMMAFASEQVAKILTDLGCQNVQEHNVGAEEAGVTAKVDDVNSGVRKSIYVDFENVGPGKMRVWVGVEEGR